MSDLDQAEQIRRQMAFIRRELTEDVDELQESAQTLLNWHYYVNNYPWACMGVAAAIGYLVVPRKLEIHRPDPKTLEKLARDKHLVIEQKPEAQAKGGLIGTAFSFVSGLLFKTAMAQLGHQLADAMDQRFNPSRTAEKKPAGGSPPPRPTPAPSSASPRPGYNS